MPGLPEERRLFCRDGIFAAGFTIRIMQLQDSKRLHDQIPIRWRWPGPVLGLLRTALARFLTRLVRLGLELHDLFRPTHITEDIGHRPFGECHLTPER